MITRIFSKLLTTYIDLRGLSEREVLCCFASFFSFFFDLYYVINGVWTCTEVESILKYAF